MKMRFTLVTAALLCLVAANALGQQKQQVSFKIPAENAKYIVSQNVDVGDAPNHIVRVFEARATLPNNAPAISGLKLAELWQRGTTDIIDGNGSGTNYFVFVAENGDKFFVRNAAIIALTSSRLRVRVSGISQAARGSSRESRACSTSHQLRSETRRCPRGRSVRNRVLDQQMNRRKAVLLPRPDLSARGAGVCIDQATIPMTA